ncbi:MAG: 50S ribosomal protein L18 [Pseudomonadota bacterium]
MDKKGTRLRRAAKTRARIRVLRTVRLAIYRSTQHIYAQIIDASGGKVLASASTVQEAVRGDLKATGNVEAAAAVGKAIAERALAVGITTVAFDRAGFRYHGRVKALADAAREAGLVF